MIHPFFVILPKFFEFSCVFSQFFSCTRDACFFNHSCYTYPDFLDKGGSSHVYYSNNFVD